MNNRPPTRKKRRTRRPTKSGHARERRIQQGSARDKRRRVNKRRKLIFISAILSMAVIGLILADILIQNEEPPQIAFAAVREVSFGGAGDAHVADNGFFVLTRDSLRFFNMAGREDFRHSISIANPALIARGGYAAVAAAGGLAVQVFSDSALLYTIASNPIHNMSINTHGAVAVVSGGIYTYSRMGLTRQLPAGDMIVISAAVSDDGRVLAVNYLDVSEAVPVSIIQFISLDSGEITAMTAHGAGQFIGSIRFTENGLLAISDRSIFMVALDSRAEILWEIELNNHLLAIEYGANWFAVAYGDEMLNIDGYPANTVAVYDLNSNRIFSHQAAGRVTHLSSRCDNLIVGVNNHFTALDSRGREIWRHSGLANVTGLYFLGNTDEVLAVSGTNAVIMRRGVVE